VGFWVSLVKTIARRNGKSERGKKERGAREEKKENVLYTLFKGD